MTRDASPNRGALIRRLQATLDARAGDFTVTPAFSARVQQQRRRRRVMRQTTQALVLAAVVVVLAVTAVNALRPAERIDFVSPITTPSPSPAETDDAAQPSPSPSAPPSETPSETEQPSEEPTISEEPSAPETEAPAETLTADTPIDLYGIGPIEAGMTLGEAERLAGVDLIPEGFDIFEGRCYHAHAEGFREDFLFLVTGPASGGGRAPVDRPEDGIIRRVSATSGMESPAETLSGVAVGDTEDEVYRTYGEQIESQPHIYIEGGHYLTYTPRDAADQDFRVVFFTDGSVVEQIHAGDAEAAGSVEGGCV